MVKYFLNPFAASGDKIAIPDPVQVSGNVSYLSGWGPDYQKDMSTDPAAKAVPRSQTNQLMYDITANLQQYQQHGFPEFITTADNGGTPFPYAKNSIVRFDSSGVGTNYLLYLSLIDNNTGTPPTSNWFLFNPPVNGVPVGAKLDTFSTVAPPGYLKCNGTEGAGGNVSRTTYAALFAVIGTVWGAGDGSTTFGLPNFARVTPVGAGGTASGILGNTVGSYGGAEEHTLTTAEVPNLNVTVSQAVRSSLLTPTAGSVVTSSGVLSGYTVSISGATTNGGGGSHSIMQKSAVVLTCIKY